MTTVLVYLDEDLYVEWDFDQRPTKDREDVRILVPSMGILGIRRIARWPAENLSSVFHGWRLGNLRHPACSLLLGERTRKIYLSGSGDRRHRNIGDESRQTHIAAADRVRKGSAATLD